MHHSLVIALVMAKSQQPPPSAQRVAEELELVQRVTKGRAAWVQSFHTKFWSAVEEADPLIQSFVREQMDAFLLAVASRHPMRLDSHVQPKSSGSLPKPGQNIPPRPPAPTSKQPKIGQRPPQALPQSSPRRRLRLGPTLRIAPLAHLF